VAGQQLKVFLSYSSRDREFARRLSAALTRAHIDVWLDELDLRAGESLDSIDSAIRSSAFLVVVVSIFSLSSPWVARELRVATNANVGVLPVIVDDAPDDSWPKELSETAHVDFRRANDYRRSLQRLVDSLLGVAGEALYLSAKEAVSMVRATSSLTGELFGLSQQGVALLYSLVNRRDWELADAMSGSSRMWVVEFYDEQPSEIHTFALVDGSVHDLGVMYPLHSVPVASDETPMFARRARTHTNFATS
jgi:hypothetical protein